MPAWIAPAAQAVVGGIQALVGGGQARRAQNQLEKMIKGYQPNRGILDYYNKALQRYNINPYTSQLFTSQQDRIRGGTAQAMQAFQDRRSALAGLPQLIQGQNDALLKAAATAEGQQAQALSQLGTAAEAKRREEFLPFEMKYNLNMMKAGGGSQIANAGLQNIFGGLGNLGSYFTARQFYGGNGSRMTGGGGARGGVGYDPSWDNYGQPG